MVRRHHLWNGDDEVARQALVCRTRERGDKDVERSQAAGVKLRRQRFDAYADMGRQRAGRLAPRDLLRYRHGVIVLLFVGTMAVAVLEVDAEVLDRLAAELVGNPQAQHVREAYGTASEVERGLERRTIGRVFIQGGKRECAQPRGHVRLEQVRTAIEGVHRLPRIGLAWVRLGDRRVRVL
jgi:hypothetical protein